MEWLDLVGLLAVSLGEIGYGLERYREVHRGLDRRGEDGRGWLSKLG